MTAYYNEWDKPTAEWLRVLIREGLIAPGIVDDRSIDEVQASDLKGFTQCHFFAGIGGWSYALRMAGVPDSAKLWTGSPPCQPFSVAGKQLGQLDERHLAPTFMRLIKQCKPPVLFGEQVAAAIGKHWLDDLFTELEGEGYACGAAVLPACSVGAPHQRYRLFFGSVADNVCTKCNGQRIYRLDEGDAAQSVGKAAESSGCCDTCSVPNTDDQRLQRQWTENTTAGWKGPNVRTAGLFNGARSEGRERSRSDNEFWRNADWLLCRDGRYRPVESGSFPLANGVPARVGRLRGYGNAIVPQVAAEFVRAFYDTLQEVA